MVVLVVGGTIVLTAILIILTPTRGVPLSLYSSNFGQACTTTTVGNTISSSCSPSFSAPYVSPINIVADFLFWFPLVGALVYGMPYWEHGGQNKTLSLPNKVARILTSSPIIAWFLFEFALPAMPYGYLSFTKGFEP